MTSLEECTYSNTPKFKLSGRHRAKCVKVYDGDTITVAACFFNDGIAYRESCRCLRYNTAEIRSSNPEEKEKAIKARDYLKSLIYNKMIEIDISVDDDDPYRRPLVEVYCDGKNINDMMLASGLAMPYNGTGEKKW